MTGTPGAAILARPSERAVLGMARRADGPHSADARLDAHRVPHLVAGTERFAPGQALTVAQGDAARHECWALGPFILGRITMSGAGITRTERQARRDLIEDWILCVGSGGFDAILPRCGRAEAGPGVPVAVSLAGAFELISGEGGCVTLFMPRDSLPECSGALERNRDLILASVPGRLLGRFLTCLAAELPRTQEAEIPRAVEAARSLLNAAIACGAQQSQVDEAELLATRLARVKAIIRQHLPSRELSPEWLCRVTGMSRSQLYRLFEPAGGVRREIQRERLRLAHRTIAESDDTRSIHRIGEAIGFEDAATFSRAFRREFGYPPSALRRPSGPPAIGANAA